MKLPGLPSQLLRSSSALGWTGVRVEEREDPFVAEAFSTRSSAVTLVRVTSGRYRIESRHAGRWHAGDYRPGSVGVTAPGNENVLRWRASTPVVMRSQHVHLNPALVPRQGSFPDALALDDAYVAASLRALEAALADEAPALYADSVAAALAAHLAFRVVPASRAPERTGSLNAGEVALVIGFMHEHLAEDITLDHLASLAGLSKYHFLRMFSAAVGQTPSRHLARLRLGHGARLLTSSSTSVAEVAASCGYRSPGQFAAAFRREYGCTPRAYRRATHR